MESNITIQTTEYNKAHHRKKRWYKVMAVLASIVVFCTTYALILPAITKEQTVYCGYEEKHTNDCYDEVKTLTCGLKETDGHSHTDECYEIVNSLICGLEETEGHIHDQNCYEHIDVLICTNTDPEHMHGPECYQTETHLICPLPEVEPHIHNAECYQTERILTCGKEECEPHKHTDSCYSVEKTLICGKKVHEHTDQCFSNPEADIESDSVWKKSFERVELTDDWNADVLAIAITQLGYTESTRNYEVQPNGSHKGYTRYGAWYGIPYGDWCAMFCSFCLNYADVSPKLMPRDANCPHWIQTLSEEKYQLYHDNEEYVPTPGDLIFYDWDSYEKEEERSADHIGFVAELIYEEIPGKFGEKPKTVLSKIKAIEGNSSNRVQYVTYDADDDRIMGYGEIPEKPIEEIADETNEDDTDIFMNWLGSMKLMSLMPGEIELNLQLDYRNVPGSASEDAQNLFDGNTETKYYANSLDNIKVICHANSPAYVTRYALTTANDSAEYDRLPNSWTLYGSNSYNANGDISNWTQLDTVTASEMRTANLERNEYTIDNPGNYKYYAIVFQPKAAHESNLYDGIQFSEWNMIASSNNPNSNNSYHLKSIGSVSDLVGNNYVIAFTKSGYSKPPRAMGNTIVYNENHLRRISSREIVLGDNGTTITGENLSVWDIEGYGNNQVILKNNNSYLVMSKNDASNFQLGLTGNRNEATHFTVYIKNDGSFQLGYDNVFLNLAGTSPYNFIPYSGGDDLYLFTREAPNDGYIVWLDGTDGGLMNLIGAPDIRYQGEMIDNGDGTNSFTLPTEWNSPVKYNYALAGWYDVYNHRYYEPGAIATIDGNTVFYADWRAANYDVGIYNEHVIPDTDTSKFVNTDVFDYSVLFNVMSTSVRADVLNQSSHSEVWTMQTGGTNEYTGQGPLDFVFVDYDHDGQISYAINRDERNYNRDKTITKDILNHTRALSGQNLLQMLFDPESSFDAASNQGVIGVNYVGTGDELYHYMEIGASNYDGKHNGYYYYDSILNAASYNQSEGRFFVYDYLERTTDSRKDRGAGEYSDILPYNSPYTNNPNGKQIGSYNYNEQQGYEFDAKGNSNEGNVACNTNHVISNYYFGFRSDIQFYLPNDSGYTDSEGNYGNQSIKGDDMQFEFSGDDDVWVFVDDVLVLDIGGLHGVRNGNINFSKGIVTTYNDGNSTSSDEPTLETMHFSAGEHVLHIYYMERGSSQANCAIYFNLAPRYTLNLTKEDIFTKELLDGAEFQFYTDANCTQEAALWDNEEQYRAAYEARGEAYAQEISKSIFTIVNGHASCWGLAAGQTYYLKEIHPPGDERYGVAYDVVCVRLNARGQAVYTASILDENGDGRQDITVPGFDVDEQSKSIDLSVTNRQEDSTIFRVNKRWAQDSIDFTNPADASKFAIINNTNNTHITQNGGLQLITSRPAFEPCNNQNFGSQATTPENVVSIPVAGDWTATLKFIFNNPHNSPGYYEFFSFLARRGADYQNMVGIRGGNENMQDFIRVNGTITADQQGVRSAPGFNHGNGTYWYRIVKTGTTYTCYRSSNGTNFTQMFSYPNTGIEADSLLIDAYTGESTGYEFTLKELTIAGGSHPPISVYLQCTAGPHNEYRSDTVILSEDNHWSYSWSGLPKAEGDEYEVVEYPVPAGYRSSGSWIGLSEENEETYELVNTPIPTSEQTRIAVRKVWDDSGNTQHPPVMISLYCDNVNTGRTVVLSQGNNWQSSFEGLPKTNNAGTNHVYTVVEQGIDGYRPEYSNNESWSGSSGGAPVQSWVSCGICNAQDLSVGGVYRFSNGANAIAASQNASTVISKTVSDFDAYQQWRVTSKTGSGNDTQVVLQNVGSGQYFDYRSASSWSCYMSPNNGKAVYIQNGKIYWRFIKYGNDYDLIGLFSDSYGNAYPAGYSDSCTTYTVSQLITSTPSSGNDGNMWTVTNIPIPTVEVSVEKQWSDGYAAHIRDSITVHLFADGVDTGKSMVVNRSTNWRGTFTQLAKFQDDGITRVAYSIEEDVFIGYEPNITIAPTNGNDNFSYVIVNTPPTYVLPESGGGGTLLFYTLGGALMLFAIVFGFSMRRKRERRFER